VCCVGRSAHGRAAPADAASAQHGGVAQHGFRRGRWRGRYSNDFRRTCPCRSIVPPIMTFLQPLTPGTDACGGLEGVRAIACARAGEAHRGHRGAVQLIRAPLRRVGARDQVSVVGIALPWGRFSPCTERAGSRGRDRRLPAPPGGPRSSGHMLQVKAPASGAAPSAAEQVGRGMIARCSQAAGGS